jgi:integrase
MLLGEDGKRRLRLRYMTNSELFSCYDSELVLRNQSRKGLYEARRILRHFEDFLGQYPPTPELGRKFLAQFVERKTTTKYRYTQIIGGFFDWYGEKLGVKVRVPRKLPEYTEERDISALLKSIETKATHKKSAERDLLIIQLALHTGLRRAELANLDVRDIHLDQGILVVRNGKGGKDAVVPLNATISELLRIYLKPSMAPDQKLLGLKPSTISGKIEWFAKKAGVSLHCHSLRHYFGTKLIECGANPEAVRQLMRHERLDTTQRYISLASKGLREAVELLDKSNREARLTLKTKQGIDPGQLQFNPNYRYYIGSIRSNRQSGSA